jgi:bla regulator protein blaR1
MMTGHPSSLVAATGIGVATGMGAAMGNHLWQSKTFVMIVWLATLLLRRSPRVGRKMVLAALVLLVIATPVAFGLVRMTPMYGQILHASGPLPSFEVVSIRPWKRPPTPSPPPSDGATVPQRTMKADPGHLGGQTTDRVHAILPTGILIESAYNLPVSFGKQILGGPDWLWDNDTQYEIQAKIEDSLYAAIQKMTPAQQREQVNLMEQSLLADRFKLKMHFETRELPVYALVVAKGGPKLTAAKEGEAHRFFNVDNPQGGEMTANAVTLDQFSHSPLLRTGGRLVVDQTGLKGAYNFTLKWRSEQSVAASAGQEDKDDAPSLFTALQEQLGLRLVPSKAPVEVIVIDHIERPSEN